jgi:hypothetical protein
VDWLEHENRVYWMSGKAGSGKSTLMSYITSEPRTEKALTVWAEPSELIMASFFFWNPGTVLQKSYLGLLRSLLYQIANQRQDLISIMMDQESRTAPGPSKPPVPAQLHTWTEKRLFTCFAAISE